MNDTDETLMSRRTFSQTVAAMAAVAALPVRAAVRRIDAAIHDTDRKNFAIVAFSDALRRSRISGSAVWHRISHPAAWSMIEHAGVYDASRELWWVKHTIYTPDPLNRWSTDEAPRLTGGVAPMFAAHVMIVYGGGQAQQVLKCKLPIPGAERHNRIDPAEPGRLQQLHNMVPLPLLRADHPALEAYTGAFGGTPEVYVV